MLLIYYKKYFIKLVAELPTDFAILNFNEDILYKYIKLGCIETNNITDWNYSLLAKIFNKDFRRL